MAVDTSIELKDGTHEVVVFVAPREVTAPTIDRSLSSTGLVEQFKSEKVFWKQFEIAKAIVDRGDASVLTSMASGLTHEDRHIRGNVAFVFAAFGDPRGLDVIVAILADRSDRPEGQGIAIASGDGRYHFQAQVREDRYYAAHLLGNLRDARAIPILVPLLKDPDLKHKVPWALEEIGDKSAVPALLDALDDDSPAMRVFTIHALETLKAREAIPRLLLLLNDHRTSNLGTPVAVSEAAKAAIARLQ